MSPISLPTQKAAVLYGPKDIRIDDRNIWPPSMNQVQISIESTGLCGSDSQSPFFFLSYTLTCPTFFYSALLCSRKEW